MIQADKQRAIFHRDHVGSTAGLIQKAALRFSRIAIDAPTLIVVQQGTKILRGQEEEHRLVSGQAIALSGGQSFDIENRLSINGCYEAFWLVWEPSLVSAFSAGAAEMSPPSVPRVIDVGPEMMRSLDRARDAIGDPTNIPVNIARHRLTEVLIWLSEKNITLGTSRLSTLASRVRRLIEMDPAMRWTLSSVARKLNMSEATLRRHLSTEGALLSELIADTRMASAMTMLQATDEPVNRIALNVGYDSASRFAIRFRKRFGFSPTAIRGHVRTGI